MRKNYLIPLIAGTILIACTKHRDHNQQPPTWPDPPAPSSVLLRDLVASSLPSPYYHFEYDNSGKVTFTSFASDLFRYNVTYTNGRISEMRNNILVNKDRLQYFYNSQGKLEAVNYADSTGLVYTRVDLFYDPDGAKLVR